MCIFCNFVKTLKSSNLRSKILKAFAMKRPYIFIIAALLLFSLNSCSVYRNNPTPDDVYYSPGAPVTTQGSSQNNNSDYYSTPNDNYVKMRVQNPDKWSYFDDYNYDYYGSSAYGGYGNSGFGMSIGFGSMPYYGGFGYYSPMSYYNSYYAWNNFYNPYCSGVIVVNGKNTTTPGYTRMSNFNPSAYKGSYYNSRPGVTHPYNSNAVHNSRTFFNSHSDNSTDRSSNSRPSYSPTPSRSTPSSFSGGGGGGGASHGGGFSRPGR